jgi:hypothetical protein
VGRMREGVHNLKLLRVHRQTHFAHPSRLLLHDSLAHVSAPDYVRGGRLTRAYVFVWLADGASHMFMWRDMYDIAVRWRQLADPYDPVYGLPCTQRGEGGVMAWGTWALATLVLLRTKWQLVLCPGC